MRAQLLTIPDCPHAVAAREALRAAIAQAGVEAPIEEIDLTGPDVPEPLRGWASPTILVDGVDVGGEPGPDGGGCRLYHGRGQAPSVEAIRKALGRPSVARRQHLVGVTPGKE